MWRAQREILVPFRYKSGDSRPWPNLLLREKCRRACGLGQEARNLWVIRSFWVGLLFSHYWWSGFCPSLENQTEVTSGVPLISLLWEIQFTSRQSQQLNKSNWILPLGVANEAWRDGPRTHRNACHIWIKIDTNSITVSTRHLVTVVYSVVVLLLAIIALEQRRRDHPRPI